MSAVEDVFPGPGEMARLMRAHDWGRSGLGHPSGWPSELRTCVQVCLESRFPIVLWWGEELRLLYNDAWRPALGALKHPAIDRPGREVWAEIWHIIGPQLAGVMETGVATWLTDMLLPMDRFGYREETYWTYSYSPIRDDDGSVCGVFTPVAETTQRVLSARRLRMLQGLGEAGSSRSVEEACAMAVEVIGRDPADIPFARIYLAEDGVAREAATTGGVPADVPTGPVDLHDRDGQWPWASVRETGAPATVTLGGAGDPWHGDRAPARLASLHALSSPTECDPIGYLVAGISPARGFDDAYQDFLALVARHAATLMVSAAAFDDERRRAQALAELDRAKTTFFSNVSHEFRTPLTLLLAPLEEARDASSALEGEPLELAHRNGLRLLRLVNTLLDFSRLEAGRVDPAFEPVEIGALTAELAASFRAVMERGGLSLVIDAEPLPEPVFIDREMWERIVLNLLSNAFKHTFAGTVTVRVRLRDDVAEMAVEDTGIGIAADQIPRLFERFHRVPSVRARSHEGTGIGLSLVDQLVRRHGGAIDVASALDRGSVFTVSIPRGSEHLPPELVRSGRGTGATTLGPVPFVEEAARWLGDEIPGALPGIDGDGPRAGGDSRILLADDNADMRRFLTRLLGARHEVEAVADGLAALASARREPPALVISDVMMPGLDGLGLVRALRDDPGTRLVPVVLLSARSGEEATIGGLEAGADDYLEKPFSAHELLARVNAHLALGAARREAAARDRLLADASLALDATIGVEQRLRAVASLLTGTLADMCVIYLAEAGGLRRAAVAHTDPAALEALLALPGPSARMRRIVEEGRSELIAEVTDEHLSEWRGDAGDLDRRRRIAPRSYCGVPIIVRGATIGAIALGRSSASDPLTPAHVLLAEELGRRAGLAVDNARLYERAQRSARVEADRAQALAELQNLTAALSEALTPSAVAGALIDIGLPLLGGVAGGLMVIDDDGRVLRSVRLGGYPAGSAADQEWRIPLSARTPLTDAVRHRAIRYAESSDEAVRRWPSMADFRTAHALGGALAAVPIVSGGRALGALAVRYPDAGPLGADARRLLETVARLAGPALVRSSHYILQHSVAETLQRSLLPLRLPSPEGLTVAAGYTAAGEGIEAGGDWYDAIELPGRRIALMVGDVVGRGPRAAAVMGQLRSALRAFASDRRDGPGEVVANLSRFASTIDGADVATACYAELDLTARRLRYVCAGHPPPLVLTADGGTRYLEGGRGVPLGVREAGEPYAEGEARIPAGATVVLYTDGLVERRGRSIDVGFGDLAAAAARRRAGTPSGFTDGILAELGGSGDDCALLICRLDPPAGTLEVEVGADARELRRARAELREWLAGLGAPPADVEDVVLASGEALANSVEHGHGSRGAGAVRLRAAMDATRSTLDVEVIDDGRWRPPPAESGDRGRGFALMRALMESVNVEHDDRGTRVAMRRRLRPDRIPPSPLPSRLPAGGGAATGTPGPVLRLEGDIDASNADSLMNALAGHDSRVRTVDLTGVAVLGSAAIQLLFGAARRLRDRGETLEIVAAPGSLSHRLLELTDLGSLCAVRDPGARPPPD